MRDRKNDPYRLMKFVAVGAGDGVAFGWFMLLVLKWMNVAGIGALIDTSSSGPLAMALMLIFFGITFGMVGIGYRVMVVLPLMDDD